jgi:hypothetical protein
MNSDDDHEWQEELEEFEKAEPEVLPCPSCGQDVYEESERCPHCGDWVMPLAASACTRSSVWIIAAILALIAILIFAIR